MLFNRFSKAVLEFFYSKKENLFFLRDINFQAIKCWELPNSGSALGMVDVKLQTYCKLYLGKYSDYLVFFALSCLSAGNIPSPTGQFRKIFFSRFLVLILNVFFSNSSEKLFYCFAICENKNLLIACCGLHLLPEK